MRRLLGAAFLFIVIGTVAYFSTVGCCHLLWGWKRPIALSQQLHLTAAQRSAIAPLEKNFLAQKESTCQRLCEKRAQLIQLIRQPEPDRALMAQITEEIGREQISLEKTTLEHLMAVRQYLEPAQQEKLAALLTGELRTACTMTACGMTPGCEITEKESVHGS